MKKCTGQDNELLMVEQQKRIKKNREKYLWFLEEQW